MNPALTLSHVILDSLNDGVYVCDRDRRIVYWNRSAERITGWTRNDVMGRQCLDSLLCHVDKDGRSLCGEEFCPLHRSMVSGTASTVPLIVFAQTREGERVPMQVSVAPIRDEHGQVIGGVETFRDVSETLADLQRAQKIQTLSLGSLVSDDPRIRVQACYTPHDIVGGDYYGFRRLDPDRYGFFLADAMGHGIAAALHTMHLSSLWERHSSLVARPAEFAALVNNELAKVVKDESFATAVCGVVDVQQRTLTFANAGGPPVAILRKGGSAEVVKSSGFMLGMMADASFEDVTVTFGPGEGFLLFTDGAVEITNAADVSLGVAGFLRLLRGLGYPESGLDETAVAEELLKYSNAIRLADDVTIVDVRFA